MITKLFEIRDKATFIPVMATLMRPAVGDDEEFYLLRRAGFNIFERPQSVILCRLECSGVDRNATYDPYSWGGGARTYQVAHQYIIDHFDELPSGAVVDVEYILQETKQPKQSERITT